MKNIKDGFIRASLIILIATGVYQATNFLFHFFSARMLGPAEYSIIASLFSIIYMLGIGSTTIQNTITKFAAKFKANKKRGKIIYLFNHGLRKLLVYSVIATLIFLAISPLIASFLKIPLISVLIISPMILLSILLPFNRGLLQGLQKFNALGMNMVIEGAVKLSLALILIYIGLKANGAMSSVVISIILAFILTFSVLGLKKEKPAKIDSKEIYNFSLISLIALFFITAMYNVDIFLVKHFFSAEQAGNYAVLSLLGKIIFFGATSIGIVMFPKIAEKNDKKVFRKSLMFTLIISVLIFAVYFLFSKTIISVAFGAEYLSISGLLGLFGIFMTLVSLSYICVLHKLAIGKKKFIFNLLIAILAEIIAIALFHSNFSQIVLSLLTINALLFISLLK